MSNFFKNLFGKAEDLKGVYVKGAVIVDVRTKEEFRTGHVAGAVNIPLDRLGAHLAELKKQGKPVIACCRSGARSASAVGILTKAGLEAFNGGGWQSLEKRIQ